MSKGTRFILCAVIGVLVSITIALHVITGIAREYVDISRQMLELNQRQYEDNQAMTARVMEMVEATPAPTESPSTLSREEAYEILKEGIREEAMRKDAGR